LKERRWIEQGGMEKCRHGRSTYGTVEGLKKKEEVRKHD
jgi:hypothetical protein